MKQIKLNFYISFLITASMLFFGIGQSLVYGELSSNSYLTFNYAYQTTPTVTSVNFLSMVVTINATTVPLEVTYNAGTDLANFYISVKGSLMSDGVASVPSPVPVAEYYVFSYFKDFDSSSTPSFTLQPTTNADQSPHFMPAYVMNDSPSYSYIRIKEFILKFKTPTGNYIEIATISSDTDYMIQGLSSQANTTPLSAGLVGPETIGRDRYPTSFPITIKLPNICQFQGYSNKIGINIFGLVAPKKIQLRIYNVNQTNFDALTIPSLNATVATLDINRIPLLGSILFKYDNNDYVLASHATDRFLYFFRYIYNDAGTDYNDGAYHQITTSTTSDHTLKFFFSRSQTYP